MMKYLSVSSGPAGADVVVDQVMVAAETVQEQDRVVLRGVELAVRDVADLQVRDHAAALELEFAELAIWCGGWSGQWADARRDMHQHCDAQRSAESQNRFHGCYPR